MYYSPLIRSDGVAFANAGTYDPYAFGKKTERFYNCDIRLRRADFPEKAVDLEVVLILQPLLRSNGKNVCDVPVVTRQTVRIEFEGYKPRPVISKTENNLLKHPL